MLNGSHVTVSKAQERTLLAIHDQTAPDSQHEQQLRQLQKVDLVGRLAAGIAHDFNNILTAILGYTDLLEQSVDATEQVRSDAGEIRVAAQRAARLTRQILAFTRHDAPSARLIDLNAIVTDVSTMLRRLIGENIELTVGCASGLSGVRADAGQIEQVLINLVVNARDAMPGGGRVAISTRPFTADAAFAAAHPGVAPGVYVLLEVADDGDGMTDQVRARLFEPFFTTKEPGRGTGLGLSVVWSVVRQSGGHVLVETAPGRGACFTVLLPAVMDALQEQTTPAPERRRLDGQATVLLVEDEEQVRSLAALWLRRHGYIVHVAVDGEEARGLVARGEVRPDVLITDVVMPSVGGEALAESLRSVFASVKVLYMSGYPSCPEVEKGLADPDVAFLQKPFSPATLLSDVRSLLTWRGPERRIRAN
jgi:two-component system cell cycle sensor histidine kinase/response regulator CckA